MQIKITSLLSTMMVKDRLFSRLLRKTCNDPVIYFQLAGLMSCFYNAGISFRGQYENELQVTRILLLATICFSFIPRTF